MATTVWSAATGDTGLEGATEDTADSTGFTHAEAVELAVDGGADSGADDVHDATNSMVAPVSAVRAARSGVFTDHLV